MGEPSALWPTGVPVRSPGWAGHACRASGGACAAWGLLPGAGLGSGVSAHPGRQRQLSRDRVMQEGTVLGGCQPPGLLACGRAWSPAAQSREQRAPWHTRALAPPTTSLPTCQLFRPAWSLPHPLTPTPKLSWGGCLPTSDKPWSTGGGHRSLGQGGDQRAAAGLSVPCVLGPRTGTLGRAGPGPLSERSTCLRLMFPDELHPLLY